MTRYCHLSDYAFGVSKPTFSSKMLHGGYWVNVNSYGVNVGRGVTIAESGNTGYSNPAHLHFEFHLGVGNHQDPDKYIPLVGHDDFCYLCHYGYGSTDYHDEYTYDQGW